MKETNGLDFHEIITETDHQNEEIEAQSVESPTDLQDDDEMDLEKRIEEHLAKNDLSGARWKLRLTIDEYCRFVKGFDMDDVFCLRGLGRAKKFKFMGFDSDVIYGENKLNDVYEKGNNRSHTDNVAFMTKEEIERAKADIRRDRKQLSDWGMDQVDKENGRAFFCRAQDARLLKILDDGGMDSIPDFDQRLEDYFEKLRGFAKDFHVDLQAMNLKFNTKQDVERHLMGRNLHKDVRELSLNDRNQLLSIHEQRAKEGNFDDCLWMGDYHQAASAAELAVAYYLRSMQVADAENKINGVLSYKREAIGTALYGAGKYSEAIKWLEGVKSDGRYVTMYLGDCYRYENREEEAVRQYRLVDVAYLTGDERKTFVADKIGESEPAEALKYYSCCTSASSDPAMIKKIGDGYVALHEFENAARAYVKIVGVKEDSEIKRRIVECLTGSAVFRALCELYPISISSSAKKIADVFRRYQKEDLAVWWYEKYVESRKDVRGDNETRETEDICEYLGYYYLGKETHKAVSYFKRCAERASRDKQVVFLMMDHLFQESEKAFWSLALNRILYKTPLDAEAIRLYEKCDIRALFSETQKAVGDYFYARDELEKATDWYEAYVLKSEDYSFALELAKSLWDGGKQALAVRLYEIPAEKTKDAAVSKRLGEYYHREEKFADACKWYERYYDQGYFSCNTKNDEELLRLLALLSEKSKNEDAVFKWKKALGDRLFDKGEVESAIALYQECAKNRRRMKDDHVAMRLASHYYFRNMRLEAADMLSLYTQSNVSLHKDFAVSADGRVFIVCKKNLIGVSRDWVERVEIKKNPSSGKNVALLCLSQKAAKFGLPKKIKLAAGADEGTAWIVSLENLHLKGNHDQNANKRSNVISKKKKKGFEETKRQPVRFFALLAVELLGIFGMIYNCEVGYHFSGNMYYVQAVAIGVLALAASIFVSCFKNDGDSLFCPLLIWGGLVVQYAIHLCFTGWLWLDPNDGPLGIAEFVEEGVIPAVIALLICIPVLLFFAKKSKRK